MAGSPISIVIVGGGIMGVCTAYYLSRETVFKQGKIVVTLVEEGEIAGGASGKAAGFIAKDWHGPPTESLAELSWRLHTELSKELDGERTYGYRRVKAYSMEAKPASQRRKRESSNNHIALSTSAAKEVIPEEEMQAPTRVLPDIKHWLSIPAGTEASHETKALGWVEGENVTKLRTLGDEETTAQVHPALFVRRLWEECIAAGVRYVRGKAVQTERQSDGSVTSLTIQSDSGQETILRLDRLLLATGPWTGRVASSLLDVQLPVFELPGHSIIYRPKRPLPAEAVFATVRDQGVTNGPEVFTRPDGTVYIAGENSGAPLPPDARAMSLSESSLDRLRGCMRILSPSVAEGEVVSTNLCYRPVSSTGYPFLAAVPGVAGTWVVAGHGPWGIALGPGSGKVASEMILCKDEQGSGTRSSISYSADVSLLGLPAKSSGK